MISFRYSKKVLPGIWLNLSRAGASVSIRPRNLCGRRRRRRWFSRVGFAGAPGTGSRIVTLSLSD